MVVCARNGVQDDERSRQQVSNNDHNDGLPPGQPNGDERRSSEVSRDIGVGQHPEIVESPEPPGPSSRFDRFDIIVDPAIWDGAPIVRDFENFEEAVHGARNTLKDLHKEWLETRPER